MKIQVGGLDIGYDLDGPDGAPVVAMGHSYCANRDLWRHQVQPLVEAGYRVLRHDVRGHGETPAPPLPFSLEDAAEDIVGLVDALGLEKVIYCGISMSGIVVVEPVFGRPGIGQLAWQAIQRVDIPIIMGVTLVAAFSIVMGNLLADIIALFVDPRIKLK